nr:hypothetical protein [Marinicella sp. W31]MDC2876238.1 hypothetical protein [Marinicella sp. W31]
MTSLSDMQEGPFPEVGLSVLTWKSPRTLERTLRSLQPVGDLFSQRTVVCQEGSPEEMDIARRYDFEPVATEKNLGIQEGLARCAESLSSERILIVESDNFFVASDHARDLLKRAVFLFDQHEMKAFQLGERKSGVSHRFCATGSPKNRCARRFAVICGRSQLDCACMNQLQWRIQSRTETGLSESSKMDSISPIPTA